MNNAAIPTILRGDDSGAITIALDDSHDYTGAVLAFAYQGVTRTFSNLVAGSEVQVFFTHDETSKMRLGAFPVYMELVGPTGGRETVANAELRIKVTDCLAEVNSGSGFTIRPGGGTSGVPVTDVGDLAEHYTLADLKAKVDQIVRVLAQRSLLSLAALLAAFTAFAVVETTTARLDELPNDARVVTNVTGGAVESVNGQTGAVVVTAAQIGAVEKQGGFVIGSLSLNQDLFVASPGKAIFEGPINHKSGPGDGEPVVYGITAGGETLHGDVDLDPMLEPIQAEAELAAAYAQGVYQYMNANTNAWFEGTNYVTSADATSRTHFAWEDGMDLTTVPCSMALKEVRDGRRQTVWDQRDWTAWYWNFKATQLSNSLARTVGELADEVSTSYMHRGWANYTAVRGLDNPDPSALIVDTPKVQLFAGHQWEKLVETGGAGYWTLTGNGIELSAADTTNTFLTVKDFEGNACLTFRKTASYLVYCEPGTDIASSRMDDQGRVVFRLTTDVQPTAEFSTTLELDSFVEQGESTCPANYEWTGTAGAWDCHFLLKPGITANACFARFKVLHEGENVVEHTVPIKLSGGIVFEQGGQSYKIRPKISGGTVTWEVAP